MQVRASIASYLYAGLIGFVWLACTQAASAADATIEGTITDAASSDPISGATVVVSDPSINQEVVSGTTDGLGNYSLIVTLGEGETRDLVIEAAGPVHAPARHNFTGNLPCFFRCGPGGEIPVASGDTITADIALDAGAVFSGTITDAATGDPLPNALVEPVDEDSGRGYSQRFRGVADTNGDYTTPLATPAGDRFVLAGAAFGDNFAAEAWNDVPCEYRRCPILDTDPLTLAAGEHATGIDFALDPGATISGTLQPDDGFRIVRVFNGAGVQLNSIVINSGEADWSFDRLSGGSYYIELGVPTGSGPFVRILHNGLVCPFSGCDRARGEPVSAPSGSSVSLDPIELPGGGLIEGVLVDSATGDPISVDPGSSFSTYNILDGSGEVVGGGFIQEDGGNAVLSSSAAVPPGDYFVRTYQAFFGQGIGYVHPGFGSDALTGYTDAVSPGIPCAGIDCDLSSATAVTVTEGNTEFVTIEMSTGSNITGSIVDDATGTPIENAIVKLVDANNRRLANTWTDETGQFIFGAFPAGSYYLRTAMSAQLGPGVGPAQNDFFDKVHGAAGNCSEQLCDPTTGTEITLDGSSDAGPFELRVESGPVIFGQIVDELTGLPIARGQVNVFNEAGDLVGGYAINGATGEYRTTALAPGEYTLEADVSPAFSSVGFSSSDSPSPAFVDRAGTGAVKNQNESEEPLVVTVSTEDVEASLSVVDKTLDLTFADRFEAEQ